MLLDKEQKAFEKISKISVNDWEKKVDDFFSLDFTYGNFEEIKEKFDSELE